MQRHRVVFLIHFFRERHGDAIDVQKVAEGRIAKIFKNSGL